MIRNVPFALATLTATLFLGACAPVTSAQAQRVTYRCDSGVDVQAFYGNANQITLTLKNRMLTLPSAQSADGARYSDGTRIWWTRGAQGFLEDNGVMTATNCQDVASPAPLPAPAQAVTLTPADAQRTTSVRVGSTITLRLPSNVTTGYRYEIQSPSLGFNVLKQTGSIQETTSTGMVGTPGTQIFTFEATRIGSDVITVIKRNPAGETVETLKFLISANFVGRI